MDPYMATIMIFAGNFAPLNWAYCDGSLQSIAENTPLFALIGTTYGGDGMQTFALPDLRGRIPVGTGSGPGISPVELGQTGGSESVTLTTNNLPPHNHAMSAAVGVTSANHDGSKNPTKLLATAPEAIYAPANAASGGSLAGANAAIGFTGGNTPISVVQPYLAINYIICVYGIFPSRN